MEAVYYRLMALGITYDPANEKVTSLPTVSEFMEAIMKTNSGSTHLELTKETLTLLADTYSDSLHFLARQVDPPIKENITLAHAAQCK